MDSAEAQSNTIVAIRINNKGDIRREGSAMAKMLIMNIDVFISLIILRLKIRQTIVKTHYLADLVDFYY
jgi:hypothetical protein